MKRFRQFKVAILIALIGVGLCGSLTACVVEEGHGGHERHWW
jgi:hypothetical protein